MKHYKDRKNVSKEERNNLINRFNKPLDESQFIPYFQKVMLERLLLNRDKRYHPKNIERIINSIEVNGHKRNPETVDTRISGGYLLSTTVEADFYVLLQEVILDVTGDYMPMDEFIHLLLTWFFQYYSRENKNKVFLPYIKKNKINNKKLINKFKNQFSPYFKNISLTQDHIKQ